MFRTRFAIVAAAAVFAVALLPAAATATFPGKNGYVYVSAFDEGFSHMDIFRLRPDGAGVRLLTDGQAGRPSEGSDPSISANGRRLSFTTGSQASSDIWVMSGNGRNAEQLTFPNPECNFKGLDQMGGISPNGQKIAFMTTRETACDALGLDHNIWTMNADGSNAQVLLDTTAEDYYPEFTPDGQSVVMATEVTGDLDIAQVTLAGAPHTAANQITEASTADERTPSVHPSGNRVAFGRGTGLSTGVFAVDFDGTGEVPIANDDGRFEVSPVYSPNGKRIAYQRDSELVIARANGSSPRPIDLSEALLDVVQIDWASDTIRPRTRITKGPRGRTGNDRARFGFKSSEAASTFRCKLDSKPYKKCRSGKTYKNLKPGRHTFKVRATDFAGNNGKPAKRAFKVTG